MIRSFKDNLIFGENGEREITELFINNGYSVVPLYQFQPKSAPKIETSIEGLITSPDLYVFKEGKCIYVEVKRKTKWVEGWRETETGINNRLYLEYKKLCKITGIDFYLFFIHQECKECKECKECDDNGIFYIKINDLIDWDWENGRRVDTMNNSNEPDLWMTFFCKENLIKVENGIIKL